MFSMKIVCSILLILTIQVFTEDCYHRSLPQPTCSPIKRGLTPDQKESILQKHNKLRRYVAEGNEKNGPNGMGQPAAEYMPDLIWDQKLEKLAQTWTDTCRYDHDMCLFGNNMGQNMGYIQTNDDTALDYLEIVQGWYNEVKDFDGTQVEEVKNFGWSAHYTQMISANTTNVGCGAILYEHDGQKRIQLICNYSPFVNMIGDALYHKKKFT